MIKKIIGAIVLPVLLAGSVCGVVYGVKYYTKPTFTELEEEIKEYKGQIESYQKLIEENQKIICDLQFQISILENQNLDINEDNKELQQTINSLNTQIDSLNQTITDNQSIISSLNAEILILNQKISELENDKNTNLEEIESLQSEIESLNNQITSLNENITEHQNTINTLNNTIDVLNGKIEDYKDKEIELNTEIANLHQSISSYEQQITNYLQIIEDLKKINSCVVTFIVDGQVVSTQQVNKTESPTLVEVEENESFVFDGWMIEGTDEIIDPFTYPITEDITFVASIRKDKVVTFTVDDSVISTQNIVTNDELEIPTPEKEHYTFLGWSLDGENVIDLSSYQINSDINLIAVFEIAGVLPYTFSNGTLTGYTGNDTSIILPTSYSNVDGFFVEGNDVQVTSIRYEAFKDNSIITNVVIPNGYTSIGRNAFSNCSNLIEVTIGENVKSIGTEAFYLCSKLSKVYFNAINVNDFYKTGDVFHTTFNVIKNLSLIIGNKVTKIPAYMFYVNSTSYSNALVNIEFEEGSVCESIGDYAFANSYSLKSIELCESLKDLGAYAFYNCTNVENLYFNSIAMNDVIPGYAISSHSYIFANLGKNVGTNVYIGDKVTYIPQGLFARYTNGIHEEYARIIEISFSEDSVCEEIRKYAFYDLVDLENINLPDSIKNISWYNFSVHCSKLNYNKFDNGMYLGNSKNQYIYLKEYESSDVTTMSVHQNTFLISSDAFPTKIENVSILGKNSIFLSEGSNANAVQLKRYLKTLTINSENIYYTAENNVLFNKDKTELIIFPSNMYSDDGSRIKYIIPNSVTTIKKGAFYYCFNLEELYIPSSVVNIENASFSENYIERFIIDSSYVYENATSSSSCGYIFYYATTIKVLKTIDDGSNSYLNSSEFSKTEEGNYYVYTKI